MKTARLITLIGSIVLFLTGCLHGVGYIKIARDLPNEHMSAVAASILKTCWLTFSVALIALAIIAFLARTMQGGGSLVLVCALASAANGLLMFHFLGPFIGVYLVVAVTLLLLVGGYLQMKASPGGS